MSYVRVTPIKPATIRKAGKYYKKKGREVQHYLTLVREARDIINEMSKVKGGEYKIEGKYLQRLLFSPQKVLSLGTKSRIKEDILKHTLYTGKRSGGISVSAYKLAEAERNIRNYNKAVTLYNKYWASEIASGKMQALKEKKLNITSKFSQEEADKRLDILVNEYKSLAYNTALKHDRLIQSIIKAIEKTAPIGTADEIIDFFTPYLNKIDRHVTYLEGKNYVEYSYEFQMNQYERLAEALGCREAWIQFVKDSGLR